MKQLHHISADGCQPSGMAPTLVTGISEADHWLYHQNLPILNLLILSLWSCKVFGPRPRDTQQTTASQIAGSWWVNTEQNTPYILQKAINPLP